MPLRTTLTRIVSAGLAALTDPEARRAAFFRCWTRKEAYLKARADGLPGRLRQWSVPVHDAEVVAPRVPGDPSQGRLDVRHTGPVQCGRRCEDNEIHDRVREKHSDVDVARRGAERRMNCRRIAPCPGFTS